MNILLLASTIIGILVPTGYTLTRKMVTATDEIYNTLIHKIQIYVINYVSNSNSCEGGSKCEFVDTPMLITSPQMSDTYVDTNNARIHSYID